MSNLIEQDELAELSSRFGQPIVWARSLEITQELFTRRQRALETKRGETVLVIPHPGQRVLLHTKAFYPAGAFRLLSGGIERDETVEVAVQRELAEETGFKIKPVRLLGVVDYEFVSGAGRTNWVSYVMLMEETDQEPHPADAHEQITAFQQVEWKDLLSVAENLERLEASWNDWGRFRAIPHRLVWQALA